MRQLTTLMLLLLGCLVVQAQQSAISGTILDEGSAEPLIGANIVIEGTSIGTATDFDGKYQFQAEPGVYTLVVSYLGYTDKKISEVEFKADETTYLDITMSDNTVDLLGEGEEIVVTAKAIERTANAVLLLQRRSDKIQDGISSQEISQLGASNAASALQKVTGTTVVDGKYVVVRGLGDRYSATMINGVNLPSIDPYRNSAQMDMIPTNFLDNIIAAKTFTPDLPGNFTGGSVNIQTKALPERFVYNISLSTSYNDQASFADDFLTFDAGGSSFFGYDDGTLSRPASLIDPSNAEILRNPSSANLARNDDAIAKALDETVRSVNSQFDPTMMTTGLNYGISADIGNQFMVGGQPLGVQVGFNFSRDYSFYNNGVFNNYILGGGQAEQLIENFSLNRTRAVENPQLSGMASLGYRLSPNNELKFIAFYSHNTEMEAGFLEGVYADYDILAPEVYQSRVLSFKEQNITDLILSGEHLLSENSGVKLEWSASMINTEQLEPDLRFFANNFDTEDGSFNISAPGNYNFPGHFYRDLTDQEFLGKVDLTIPFLQDRNKANKIKIGGLYTTKERDFNESIYSVLRRQGERFDGDFDAYLASDNVGIVSVDNDRNQIGVYLLDQTALSNSYIGEQDIFAAYGMVTAQLTPALKFIGGGRVEGTYQYVESDAAAVSSTPEDEIAEIDVVDFLPAANLVYALSENANLRASYSNTIARPNLREIAPFGSFGFIGDPPIFGNPDLIRTRITNMDLRYELFMRRGELFAVSGFYKQFQDPIVRTFRPAGNPQFTWKNVESADLYGAEIEIRKNLDFIASGLSNFTLSANLAYIYSVSDIDSTETSLILDVDPNAETTRPFVEQSPFIVNANLTYNDPESGWDAALAFNYFDDRLIETGVQATPDVYELGRGELNFSIGRKIGRVMLRVRARNLLNPDFQRFSTFKDVDYIYSRFRRGRTFSFSISYGI